MTHTVFFEAKSKAEEIRVTETVIKVTELLLMLRQPTTRADIEERLGISRATAQRWLRAVRKVAPVKRKIRYHGPGRGRGRECLYWWDQGLHLVPVKSQNLHSLHGCLRTLGATEEEIKQAHDNEYRDIDYEKWVKSMYREYLKRNPPSETAVGNFSWMTEARDRAINILAYKKFNPFGTLKKV